MPIVCLIKRGQFVESKHLVYATAVDEEGKVYFASGDPLYRTCVRSALKPFQAAASVKAGALQAAGFNTNELALMCASHNGENIHVEIAQSMISKLGFSERHYECGSHYPYERNSKWALIRAQENPTPFHNNCSGKHAGMLCLAKFLSVDPRDYTDPGHPVQKAIFDLLKSYTGLDEIPYGIDGCSAPTPFFTLQTIAQLFQKLASGIYPELETVYRATTSHPYLIAGKNRFDTDFLSALEGRAVTKVGGEAIRGIGFRLNNGKAIGLALKVIDGNQRCLSVATIALLKHLNLLSDVELDKLADYQVTILKNHRQIVTGEMTAKIEN